VLGPPLATYETAYLDVVRTALTFRRVAFPWLAKSYGDDADGRPPRPPSPASASSSAEPRWARPRRNAATTTPDLATSSGSSSTNRAWRRSAWARRPLAGHTIAVYEPDARLSV